MELTLVVSIFQSAKMEVKMFRPTKIEKRLLLYLPMLQTFTAFTTLGHIQSKNKDAKSVVSIFLRSVP